MQVLTPIAIRRLYVQLYIYIYPTVCSTIDEEACTRCALCVDRCPTGVISLGKFAGSLADAAVQNGVYSAPWDEDSGERSDRHGYIYGRL